MEMNNIVINISIFLLTVLSYFFIRNINKLFSCISIFLNSKEVAWRRGKLPPGSMGWPFFGETPLLYSQDPNVFFAEKQRRYGEIFKTQILGYPCVMLTSPEAARFVLVTEAALFKPTYPRSKEILIGPNALFFHQGDYHARLRKLVQGSLYPDAIRNLVPGIEAIITSTLESWSDGRVINTFQEMKKCSFEVGILTIFGHLDSRRKEELKKNYSIVERGYNSFPTVLPGTLYGKALKARKMLSKILNEIIRERKEKRMPAEKDLLEYLLNSKDGKDEVLSEDQIADNIIGVLFAAQDTTASVMTWIIKYLYDNLKLLEAVKAEQKAVYQSNVNENRSHLTWTQTRNMPITHKLIMETLRMASIISFTFREAVTDVEYKGYLIPKGWKVLPLFRNIHHNPDFFNDPHTFDPSRFEVAPKPNTFMPFGSGVHACPGNELAKLEMLVLIHHLVSKFRYLEMLGSPTCDYSRSMWEVSDLQNFADLSCGWEVRSQSGTEYGPFPVPLHGLPARFWKESST